MPGSLRTTLVFSATMASAALPSIAPGAPTTPPSGDDIYTAPPTKSATEAAPPSEPAAIDVSVHEDKPEPEAVGLTKAETRLLPGAFGDPFRAIEALPGVTPLASGLPYFYIRGAPPGNVGYYLDGIRVPLLFHLGLGPAVIHPGLIGDVDLFPHGSTSLGRFAGGIVSAEPAAPRPDPHAEANIRIIDAGAIVEIPFAQGKADAVVAGRYSYTGPLFSLIESNTSLAYGDYAARFTYAPNPHHRFTFFAFGSYDHLGQKQNPTDTETTTLVDTMFHRIDLRYDQQTDSGVSIRHDVILGWDQTNIGADRNATDKMLDLKSAVVAPLSDDVVLRAGIDLTLDDVDVNLTQFPPPPPDPQCLPYQDCFAAFFHSRSDLAGGAYAEWTIHLGDRFTLVPGVRADVYMSSGVLQGQSPPGTCPFADSPGITPTSCMPGPLTQVAVDPRISTRTRITDNLTLESFAGLSSQPPSFIVSGPGFRPPLDNQGLQRALSATLGVEWKPEPTWTLRAAVYATAFFNLNDALGTSTIASSSGFTGGLDRFDRRYQGRAEGLELSVKRRLTRDLGGILAYTLGRSDRIGPQGEQVPSGFDRTHVASVALTYDFGKGFHAGLKNLFYTGNPVLTRDPKTDRIIDTGKRLSPFYRLDARFEKRFTILTKGYLSLVAEMLNVFIAKETIGVDCSTGPVCQPQYLGPVVIPSIGIEGGF